MAPASSSALRVLLVDRDPDTAAAIRTLLRGRGHNPSAIEYVDSADAALPAIEQRSHDVCVLERSLDAETAGALLRGAVAAGYCPVLLLDGHRDLAVERDVLETGAADFVWKEEMSAPLVDRAVRHAAALRDHGRHQRQLHLVQRMETLGQLAGGIAHEFNNILTAIVGFSTLLAERVDEDGTAAGQVREILSGTERATTLTRDLLAFSRRQVLRPAPVALRELLPQLARSLGATLGPRIEVHVQCPEHVSLILADRVQLEQVVTNLAINAREAMPQGGHLMIEVEEVVLDQAYCAAHISAKPGRHVRLCISDTGAGIPGELLQHVFEPLFTTRDRATSPGLGLSTVYGIVKQSGGNIWVYSEPNVGTTFKLYFPAEAPEAVREATPLVPQRGAARGTETILLVDDAEMVRRLARDVLSAAGYHVLEAGGADEALQVAGNQHDPIDLLVTDVVMPGRNGIELAERLRTARGELPVLYISGYTDMSIVRHGLLSQDAAFLQKPFTPDDLLRKVKQVLEAGAGTSLT